VLEDDCRIFGEIFFFFHLQGNRRGRAGCEGTEKGKCVVSFRNYSVIILCFAKD
jgi:hypothetical protein